MHASHFSMLREEFRNFERIFRMRAHTPRQRAHSAQDQPAIERRGDGTALVLDAADPPKEFIVFFGDDNSSEDIAMPAEILRCGVEDGSGAEIEWPLQERRPGVVTNESRAGVVYDLSNGGEIDNFQQRIGWRFSPGQFCIWPQRFFNCVEIAHIDEMDLKSPD